MFKVYARRPQMNPGAPWLCGGFKSKGEAEKHISSLKEEYPHLRFFIKEECVSESQAREFWRDLMGTLWHDPDTKTTHGTMSTEHIAETMGLTVDKAEMFLRKCLSKELRLTDRQGGGWVV